MPSTLRHIRRPLIALVAVCAASFAASDASACSAMTQSKGERATACGCCTGGESTAPVARAEVATPAALPRAPRVGCPAPGETCSCRSEGPTAPEPKPARSSVERRTEPSNGSAFIESGDAFAARTTFAPQVPATQSPPRAPLYLQNVRLLF
jgi:hypothetical protein